MDHLISRLTWQDQLATAAQTPWLAQTVSQRSEALLPQFAAWYGRLQAWPRRLRRALQRKLALPLAGVALLLALGEAPCQAATITVDRTTCTLVDAITAANTDTAQGGCPAGSGADTLVLAPPRSMVRLSRVDNTTYGPTGLSVISSIITIAGQGGTIAREASAPAFRLVAVSRTGHLTLQDVTLTGGAASGSFPEGSGGGVFNHNGTVALENSSITGNTADSGGGISNWGDGTTLTLVRSTISGNKATGLGGGLENIATGYARGGVTVTLTHSTISGNTALDGGGMGNFAGYGDVSVTLTRSTISGNTATHSGGGLSSRGFVRVALTQSTIAGNTAGSSGGGIDNSFSIVTLTQSTVSGNTARRGGGVFTHFFSIVTLAESTITGNTATDAGGGVFINFYDDVQLTRSLVTGNLAPTAPEIEGRGSYGYVRANAFNLFGFSGTAGVTGFTPGPTDLVPSEPLAAILDPLLAAHGGPTLTHALVPGSLAIDVIPWGGNGCGTTLFSDQRGRARPQPAGGACDVGAYEVDVAGQPLGAWVVGFAPRTVVCKNVTTMQEMTINDQVTAWDCEAAGLGVSAGDHVAMRVRGTVAGGATDVGGAVTGLQPSSASCTNLTTGQQVQFRMMRGATAGSCVAAGLVVHPGDLIQLHVQGVAE